MKIFTAKTEEKLSKMLLREFGGILSYGEFCQLLRKKDIKVCGKRVKKDMIVHSGDEVVVYYGNKRDFSAKVLFEDENVLAVVKPKSITSESFFDELKEQVGELYFCHRLDRNTDGVMIFAKNQAAFDSLLNGFKTKKFEKFYVADVYGNVENDCGTLTNYLQKDAERGIVTVFDKPKDGAKKAVLEFEVEQRFGNKTKLKIKLLTGRTHQIRAQLAHIGHFVLGDGKYGDDRLSGELGATKMALSAKLLILHFEKNDFLAYLDGKRIEFNN